MTASRQRRSCFSVQVPAIRAAQAVYVHSQDLLKKFLGRNAAVDNLSEGFAGRRTAALPQGAKELEDAGSKQTKRSDNYDR